MGNCIATTLPDGRTVNKLYYGSGHLHQINLDGRIISDIERDHLHWETLRSQGRMNTSFQYDLTGRLTGKQTKRPGAGILPDIILNCNYSYDEHGRTRSKQTASGTQYYHYDAGHRLDRDGKPCNRTTFLWDRMQMIQESSADKRQSLYLYTGEGCYEPLARIDRNGNQEQHIYYFHTDLNGLPEELTDEAGEIVWECSYQL